MHHYFLRDGDLALVKFILEHVDSSITPDKNGCTPITEAAHYGHNEVIKVLITYTDNPNATGADDIPTPIFTAAFFGHAEVVKTLGACCGDNPNVHEGQISVTPMHCAADKGHIGVVKALIELIDDPWDCVKPDSLGETPIHLAARGGHIEVVKALAAVTSAEDVNNRSIGVY